MGIINTNKEVSATRIQCNDTFQVRLSLTAAPTITNNPTDIVLVLDRSGSMSGSALANLKNGAKAFIDIIDEATDGVKDGQIGSGSRIGIVSFATTATKDTQMITSVSDLKAAVDGLSAGGDTNHADAFTKAMELLSQPCGNAKVIVMFTDGKTTVGGNASPIAAAARAAGATIYCIGLSGSDGFDAAALYDWASKPSSSYVVITPNDAELEDLFADLARNISKPGATNITINDMINPCFRVISVARPTKGVASMLNATSVQWRIDQLGTTQQEGAVLEFTVEHVGSCTGDVAVNEAVYYSDNEGNAVTFPSPRLDVECDVVLPETCPTPVDLAVDGCEDTVEFAAGDLGMESLGRIVQLDVRLRNVCPNKRVALAAILTEVDNAGVEHKRGMKTMAIPAHTRATCRDVTVRCIKFVLPESLDVTGSPTAICNRRNFRARFIAHYIDNDYDCCPSNDM
ncbi:MAG: VWA domain-containing protein [Christensenellaceae bacterium]|nr:VWA domain-containing protein [Christensenellaceae bacterium]